MHGVRGVTQRPAVPASPQFPTHYAMHVRSTALIAKPLTLWTLSHPPKLLQSSSWTKENYFNREKRKRNEIKREFQ